ncbi:hypothetical protein THASP1DRAFT_32361 [Thamnocephalis sphaerospora]|uniref:Tyrosinase copper-binding domain-containing protein n=1 Tax=Thamnocephalis sphaerospora TaxID=78915 RepID=A0A4P9XKL8_9FUNG|nr:hypothetical protein THASP1DRAFT_32361 [Thamnocephalis sphaerospora]|eukprot:RKP05810.1 hypothetical protein THASP1DRAFT_32361 [Thamnocephalis sphaerospora]
MQLGTVFVLASTLLLTASSVWADTCTTVGQHREFRQLTHAERFTFLNAIKTLQEGQRSSRYEQYVQDYVGAHYNSHRNVQFLPWHRAYLRDMEKSLQAIDPPITLPYWDWAYDYEAPHTSLLFNSVYYGGNGDPNDNNCVPNGVFIDWKPNNGKDCITRTYDGGNSLDPWRSWSILRRKAFSQSSYKQICTMVDIAYQNVQNGIGGQLPEKMSSDYAGAYSGLNRDFTEAKKADMLVYGYRVEDPTTTGGSLPTTTGVPPYIHGNIPKNDTYVNTTVPGTGTKPADNTTTHVPGHNNGKVYPPASLPETWCKANNVPVELVRAVEAAAYKDIEQLNRQPGYISKPDLVSRVDALKQYAKQDEKLINYVGSKVTDIKYDSNNPEIVGSVRTKVATVLEQVYKQVNIVYPKAAENTYNSANVYSGGKSTKRCRRVGLQG